MEAPETPEVQPGGWSRFWGSVVANPAAVASLASAVAALLGVAVTLGAFISTSADTEKGQNTDRYIRAVAQLGEPAPEVRIGGIYGLERLARDSPDDQSTVVEVLAAYVRNHLPFADSACLRVDAEARRTGFPPLIPSDVVAAVDVLARRDRHNDQGATANLVGVCLPGSTLLGGRDLSRFDLSFANLDDANLVNTDLTGVRLVGANLLRAEFGGAVLSGADVDRSHLSGAKNVDLSGTIGAPAEPPGGR